MLGYKRSKCKWTQIVSKVINIAVKWISNCTFKIERKRDFYMELDISKTYATIEKLKQKEIKQIYP